jgi:hypothetical protein
MQRLGVVDSAAEHVRNLLAKAERVDVEHVTNANAWRAGGVTIVTDSRDEVVQTVLREVDE